MCSQDRRSQPLFEVKPRLLVRCAELISDRLERQPENDTSGRQKVRKALKKAPCCRDSGQSRRDGKNQLQMPFDDARQRADACIYALLGNRDERHAHVVALVA